MNKKKFKIQPKNWPKEYTFEEFKVLNPNINENILINYYNKYLQEYAENYSRHVKHFEDNKKLLTNNLQEIKNKYDDSQHFLKMYYHNQSDAAAGQYPPFTPTDVTGLTHWFKVEPEFIQSQDVVYNATTNIQEIVSWSSAVGDSHLVRQGNQSGYYVNDSVSFFRGRTYTSGNTGGQRMKLTDTPRFGAFTYFGVLEFNAFTTSILTRNSIHDTGSIVYTKAVAEADCTERNLLIQESTTPSENYRLVFSNNSLTGSEAPDYANLFPEQVVLANIDSVMSAGEKTDNNISASTLSTALNEAINTIPLYTSSYDGGTKTTFIRYPATSSITNLPSDGLFNNALGDSQTIVLTSGFAGTSIIQSAQSDNSYHGIWAGQNKFNNNLRAVDNNIHLFGRPIAITGSMRLLFGMAASSSIDTGDTTGTVEAISNDPDHNQKFVLMVTKDAPENAVVKVYVNNVSVFPEGSEAAGNLELDELAHFEPKFFGHFDAQTRTLNGKVYEMGFYTGSLSDSDRTQLYYYLGTKHNIHNYDGASTLQPYNYPEEGYLP